MTAERTAAHASAAAGDGGQIRDRPAVGPELDATESENHWFTLGPEPLHISVWVACGLCESFLLTVLPSPAADICRGQPGSLPQVL